jgi:4-amino-4-deoxy-L-arabinose transferase-like glycosyltransferase
MADRGRLVVPVRLCVASLLWGVFVISAGFWFPAVSHSTEVCPSGRGPCTTVGESTATLVTTEGPTVLYWLAIPAVTTVVVGVLVRAAGRGSRVARTVAWCAVGLLWGVSLLGVFSIGPWFFPSAVLLSVAVDLTRARARTATPDPMAASR